MPFYENVFIARQDVTAAQVEGLTEQFAGIITAQGGNVTKREYWGLKSLSYRVRKNRKGHYTLLNIDAPAAAVIEMERQMRLHEDVLRQLTVRVDALEEGPSAMLQSKGRDRDDRGPRGDRDRGPRGDRDDRGPRGDRGRDGGDRFRSDRAPRAEAAPASNEGDAQ
ncbi:MAG TPA: 30S ribosomal protein S6 [Dongiaceae bacterium]|jgi:small subunit ribosomal protein S6|nr:30S ribosomal protein S6 [Dongiaceae bacterium]